MLQIRLCNPLDFLGCPFFRIMATSRKHSTVLSFPQFTKLMNKAMKLEKCSKNRLNREILSSEIRRQISIVSYNLYAFRLNMKFLKELFGLILKGSIFVKMELLQSYWEIRILKCTKNFDSF